MNQFRGDIQLSEDGKLSSRELIPISSIGFYYKLNSNFSIHPEVTFGLSQKARDSKIRRKNFILMSHLAYKLFSSQLSLRIGTGIHFMRISGKEKTQRLRDGNRFVDFPMPQDSSTSQNLLITPGIEWMLIKNWPHLSIRYESHFYNLFDSLKSTHNQSLSLHFHILSNKNKRASKGNSQCSFVFLLDC